jgi:hypothetical protein
MRINTVFALAVVTAGTLFFGNRASAQITSLSAGSTSGSYYTPSYGVNRGYSLNAYNSSSAYYSTPYMSGSYTGGGYTAPYMAGYVPPYFGTTLGTAGAGVFYGMPYNYGTVYSNPYSYGTYGGYFGTPGYYGGMTSSYFGPGYYGSGYGGAFILASPGGNLNHAGRR